MSGLARWVLAAPSDDFWLAAGLVAGVAAAGFAGAFYFFSRQRLMQDTPTSRIRSAAQGYVELEGSARLIDGPPILAPLTGRTCVWYRYEINQRRGSGKNSRWVTIERGTSEQLFLLVDETGQCVIDPEGASVTAGEKDSWYGRSARPPGGPETGTNMLFGNHRYIEHRIRPGSELYAIGLFKTVGGAGGEFDLDSDVRELLREWKQDSDALMSRFDRNRDGEIDMTEWQQVREAALAEVMSHHSEMKSAPPVSMLGKTCDRRRPYILSAVPQHVAVRRYRLYAAALITLFFAAGSLAAWMIGLRLAGA